MCINYIVTYEILDYPYGQWLIMYYVASKIDSTLVSLGQPWSALVSPGQPWSALVSPGQPWSALVRAPLTLPEDLHMC